MVCNIAASPIQTLDGSELEVVDDFKYLGAWIGSGEKDFSIRKGQAWRACNSMNKMWKTSLSRNLKTKLFTTTVESVLMYGAETWTITSKFRKALDGCYTRLLRKALNVTWQSHTTNKELCGNLSPISERLKAKRMRFAGHCARSETETASRVLLWQPTHGKGSRGQPRKDYIKQLIEDTGIERQDIRNCMQNRVAQNSRILFEYIAAKARVVLTLADGLHSEQLCAKCE
ncbi:uncharacterized protein [Amphiura filiformis]|uniref:uncharacterized protein n=1 Tax=Amphiura filiformis TaxID=82378 RepID=UPI003B20DE66